MVQVSDVRIGQAISFAPLPPFPTASDLLADALPVLDPPSRMSVTDAAERYVRIQVQGAWQPFDRSVTPYMVEPSDMTQSRLFKAVAFTGPSQSGKTKMLETTAMHAVCCDQRPILIVHMTQRDRDIWVEDKLDPTILNSPALFDRMGRAREDSTFSRKRFRGMRLTIGYPTPTILSGGTYGLVLLTDYDHMPLVLGGKDNPEGSPFGMALQRIKTYLSRGCVLAEGSPAYPVIDKSWRVSSEAPHEMPPVKGGIIRLYNEGTRGRLYWECRECGGEFEPRFDALVYDENLSPGAAGETARMQCPHCEALYEHRHKMGMNRAILKGRGGWRHEAEDGTLVSVDDPRIRKTMIASYHLNGAAASFSNWSEMVANYLNARRTAETLGEDTDLARVHYTEIGVPHLRPSAEGEDELGVQFLRDHLQPAQKGIAPDWTRFVTISVDVQGTWFPVQITAWGEGGQAQVVDRFDLTQPPKGAPNASIEGETRKLDPARYIEDWQVLEALASRVVPVAGTGYGLKPVYVVVDFQGKPGVSDNAEKFLRSRRAAGDAKVWRLSRGQGGWKVPFRVKYERPERGHGGKAARGIKLLTVATDRLKDTFEASLKKASGGAGAFWLPEWMGRDEEILAEYVAEERKSDGWDKKPGQLRNEGTDLSVQARAAAELKGLLRIDWSAPPTWALGGAENAFAVPLDDAGPAPKKPDTPRGPAGPVRINYLNRG
ncbi:phage terminase large subunit family protein [Mameliella alba]|nr:phage terminase large subunit family protein [Mameliella alba]MBY6168496.1 phage terminase large subunit family protein [Mameliella alba]MBY6173515.1 phage terminase large subunit family protein [Mameliella alba]